MKLTDTSIYMQTKASKALVEFARNCERRNALLPYLAELEKMIDELDDKIDDLEENGSDSKVEILATIRNTLNSAYLRFELLHDEIKLKMTQFEIMSDSIK